MSPYRVDARLSGRHPFEIYMLYLAFLTSIPILLGVTPRPNSINAVLPHWMAIGWAIMITIGTSAALIGIYLKNRGLGLILEQLGLALTGVMTLALVACGLYFSGLPVLLNAAILGGFGIACLRRYFQIQQILDQVAATEKRVAASEKRLMP